MSELPDLAPPEGATVGILTASVPMIRQAAQLLLELRHRMERAQDGDAQRGYTD